MTHPTPTPAERAAMRVAAAVPVTSRNPGYSLTDQIVFALGSAGLLIDPDTALELQRLRALHGSDQVAHCARCGCTDDRACEGGCYWVPNALMQDLCSACILPDGSCATPGCGTDEEDLDESDPTIDGWTVLRVAGSQTPARWYCSPWCVTAALEAAAAELDAARQTELAGGAR